MDRRTDHVDVRVLSRARRSPPMLPFLAALAFFGAACVHATPPADPHARAASPIRPQAESKKIVPEVGDDPARIEAYLQGLEDDIGTRSEPYLDARRNGSDEELAAVRKGMNEARWRYEEERYRLHPGETEMHSPGMAVAGGVLTGLGGAGAIFTALWIPIVGPHGDLTAIIVGPISAVFLTVGIPVLAVGAHQVSFAPSQRAGNQAVAPEITIGASGITSAWRF